MQATIRGIEYVLPGKSLTTAMLSRLHPEWDIEKLDARTGIRCRHIAKQGECASDLAVEASLKLFGAGYCEASQIDFVVLCTQSPDYLIPTTACLIQERLGIPTNAGAFDYNLGCSGFVYGLGICHGLISTGQACNVLLLLAETYSKHINSRDRQCRAIFGDGAAAVLVQGIARDEPLIGPFVYGTDGRGAKDLILPNSAARRSSRAKNSDPLASSGYAYTSNLNMNGNGMFQFASDRVPKIVECLLRRARIGLENVDLFVFHQANAYLMEELRKRIGIPHGKFQVALEHCGNTVSATIPIALKHAQLEGKLPPGAIVMLIGFGVGYSWSATLVRWTWP